MPIASEEGFRVVCLGGSAGGLEGYLGVLRNIPPDSGMAFVVPHLSLEHAHLLPKLLAGATAMPVAEVEQGMILRPDCVFVMPPGKDMTINHNGEFQLQTTILPRKGWPVTISIFLLSLAETYGNRAVAVILSGLDHDGSAALKAIKAVGGMTFAQADPAVGSMPLHAIDTGHVDFVLPPVHIAKALLGLMPVPASYR